MDDNERILAVFSETDIEGLDLSDGVARFGGNPKLYIKIIKTFADTIGKHLDTLAAPAPEKLEEYRITVHGIKGSCYGISAKREGDLAKELEFAAKEEDYNKVVANNAAFIEAVNELVVKLRAMLDKIENSGGDSGKQKKPAPDRVLLSLMLQASRDFDITIMQEALKGLEQFEYESGGDLVKWLSEHVTAFEYDKIEERLSAIL